MNAETLVQGSLRQRLLIQLLAVFALLAVLLVAAPAALARRVRWHLDVDPIETD